MDFKALKPGDRVECRIGDAWHFCEVRKGAEAISGGGRMAGKLYVSVRRIGLRGGWKWPTFTRGEWQFPRSIRPATADVVTCNVFADYLDEQGEHRAAEMLRKAFPLIKE